MDMNISGSGKIPAGEYDQIKVSGSAEMQGTVRCTRLHVSGSLNASAKRSVEIKASDVVTLPTMH